MKRSFTLSLFLATSLFGISQSPRTVLLEVSESTWTPNTSTIVCSKEDVKSLFGSDIAVISYHWDDVQNGGDPMFKTFAEQWALTFGVTQWGRGAIDRVSYNGTTITSLDPSVWSDTIAARLNRTTIGEVTLPEVLYDQSLDEIFVRVQMKFSESFIDNKEMRFFCYLVEDGVVADQLVDTFALGNCTLYSDTLDTTFNFSHQDVARLNPSTYEGTDGILPVQASVGNQYNSLYTFDKPAGSNLGGLRVVAFVAEFDDADITKNQVINAAHKATFTNYDKSNPNDPNHPDNQNNPNSRFHPNNWPTAVKEQPAIDISAKVYPNPVKELGIIEFTVPSTQNVAVSLMDIHGRKVLDIYRQTLAAGHQKAAFTTRNLKPGMYIARIQGEGFVQQVNVLVQE